MPYVTKEERELLLRDLIGAESAGQLNYLFTSEIQSYIQTKGLSYQTLNDIIGALEGAKLELYRRVAANYEDRKRNENGDVY